MYAMSIAPANSASIADGPALKLFHSILVCGPSAFSNQPFAFPIMACGWVILGNAPTRTTTCCALPCTKAASTIATAASQLSVLIRAPASLRDHAKHPRLLLLSCFFVLGSFRIGNICEAGALQDFCGCIANLQKDPVQRTVRNIPVNLIPQSIRIAPGGERTID